MNSTWIAVNTGVFCHVCLHTDRNLKAANRLLADFHNQLCGFPQKIYNLQLCFECEHLLRKFYIFKDKCVNADKILQNLPTRVFAARISFNLLYTLLPPSSLGHWIPNSHNKIYDTTHEYEDTPPPYVNKMGPDFVPSDKLLDLEFVDTSLLNKDIKEEPEAIDTLKFEHTNIFKEEPQDIDAFKVEHTNIFKEEPPPDESFISTDNSDVANYELQNENGIGDKNGDNNCVIDAKSCDDDDEDSGNCDVDDGNCDDDDEIKPEYITMNNSVYLDHSYFKTTIEQTSLPDSLHELAESFSDKHFVCESIEQKSDKDESAFEKGRKDSQKSVTKRKIIDKDDDEAQESTTKEKIIDKDNNKNQKIITKKTVDSERNNKVSYKRKNENCEKLRLKRIPYTKERSLSFYNNHQISRHGKCICNVCGRSFVSQTGLYNHKTRKHKESAVIADDVKCVECVIGFVSEEAFLTHVRISHEQEALRRPTPITIRKRLSQPRQLPVMTCRVCNASGTCNGWLDLHFRLKHPDLDISQYLDGQAHLCHVCGRGYTTASTLRHHLNKHAGARPFASNVCHIFHGGASLSVHRLVHAPPSLPVLRENVPIES